MLNLNVLAQSPVLNLIIVFVITDTIFGSLRAAKEKRWNSSVGIDGGIRKIAMIISMCFLIILDSIIKINLIQFIPQDIKNFIHIDTVNISMFFAFFYIAYELVSILKNMCLCGLPVKRIWLTVRKFLSKYTSELPEEEG